MQNNTKKKKKVEKSRRGRTSAGGNSKQRILNASLREFAAFGFEGARVDRIAENAGINKAMIFYYFSSKQNLFRTVVSEVLLDYIPKVQNVIRESSTPEQLFDALPSLYIRYFSKRKEIIQIIAHQLIHSPKTIAPVIGEIFAEVPDAPSKVLPVLIKNWHRKGLISESDPIQFILNVLSLCLLPIVASPMVEGILNIRIQDDASFLEKRIRSITHLIKRGMLK